MRKILFYILTFSFCCSFLVKTYAASEINNVYVEIYYSDSVWSFDTNSIQARVGTINYKKPQEFKINSSGLADFEFSMKTNCSSTANQEPIKFQIRYSQPDKLWCLTNMPGTQNFVSCEDETNRNPLIKNYIWGHGVNNLTVVTFQMDKC